MADSIQMADSILANLRAKAENDWSPPLDQLYEAQTGIGDAPFSYARSAAYMQLLRAALLSQQVMGRSNESHHLWGRKIHGLPFVYPRSAD
jgi:hypothetical protein